MSIASGYGPNWSTDESRGLDAQRRIAELEQQLAAAQAEARELRERAEKAERNYQWMVERAADQHLSGYRELARRAADAENVADGLRAELARELCPEVIAFAHLMQHKLNMNAHKDGEGWGRDSSGKRGWKSCSPQFLMDKLYEEVLELTIAIHEGDSAKSIRQEAADVGNIAMMLADVCGALSQAAEQHDPLAVSDHCGECGEPEPECACDERESLPLMARDTCTNCGGTGVGGYHVHAPQEDAVEALRCEACEGFGFISAAQESGDA